MNTGSVSPSSASVHAPPTKHCALIKPLSLTPIRSARASMLEKLDLVSPSRPEAESRSSHPLGRMLTRPFSYPSGALPSQVAVRPGDERGVVIGRSPTDTAKDARRSMLASSSQAARDLPPRARIIGLIEITNFAQIRAEKSNPAGAFRLALGAGAEALARLRRTRAVILRPSTRREGIRRSARRGVAVGNRARTTPRFPSRLTPSAGPTVCDPRSADTHRGWRVRAASNARVGKRASPRSSSAQPETPSG